jgi:hypothetical protein
MWVILASRDDVSARWAVEQLQASRPGHVVLVESSTLACAAKWCHRVDSLGATAFFSSGDGTVVRSEDFVGGLCRLAMPPPRGVHLFRQEDQEYAEAEWTAFCVSALAAFPGWLNPVSPAGLAGRYRNNLEWTILAARAGLSVTCHRNGDDEATEACEKRSFLILDEHVFPSDAPETLSSRLARLISLAELRLAGVTLTFCSGEWAFLEATTLPDLRIGGMDFIRALLSCTE